jgi:aminoglycoside 2''-phosphotransferase
MKKPEKHIEIIQKDFPDFSISSMQLIGEGDNSKAFSVDKKYVFRFPKRKGAKIQAQREILTLPIIRPFVNLQIPDFKFVSPRKSFVGYEIIRGEPLTSHVYNSLSKNVQKSIQHSIGEFLFQLHHIPLSHLKDCGLETMDLKEEYAENFERAKQFIYPNVSKGQRNKITGLFLQYLNDTKNFKYAPVLNHNDFSKDHILFDVVKHQMTGIIDFGDIALGDPDYDFMYLFDEFGIDFLNGILKIHNQNDKNNLMKKLEFFSFANKIQIILMEKEANDSEALQEAYNILDVWLNKHRNTNNKP